MGAVLLAISQAFWWACCAAFKVSQLRKQV
jgi:hypothetical protein